MIKTKKNCDFGKVVQLTKDGHYVATYESCYTAAKGNLRTARRINKCCNGKKGSTGGFIWMFQEDYHAQRIKVRYWFVEKSMFNLKNLAV